MVLDPIRFPVAGRRDWLTLETVDGECHVIPSLDGSIAPGHVASSTCFCGPFAHRDGPLSEVIFCHEAPEWPGSHGPHRPPA